MLLILLNQVEIRIGGKRQRVSSPLASRNPPEQRHHKEEVPQAGGEGGLPHGAGEESQGEPQLEANVGRQGTLQVAGQGRSDTLRGHLVGTRKSAKNVDN